ncbi:MAG: hypothetical protein NTY39_05190 [Campylobacterales bacterium]|jgi:hypothetical protein|nr:hypothetical protein [Campylobacterales bacterium]
MEKILTTIESFIGEHHLLSLATIGEEIWCTSLFYAYDSDNVAFIVATDPQTLHGSHIRLNTSVAGTVALETSMVGKILGIQFSGIMRHYQEGEALYFKAFPFARVMNPTLWKIRMDEIKMTDNRLGFGKKLIWKRSS